MQFENVSKNVERYFEPISKEDIKKVSKWVKSQSGKTDKERMFLSLVRKSCRRVWRAYWIATIEPSIANGEIYYAEGEDVGVKVCTQQWAQMAKGYNPSRGSRLATLYELFIWYALRIINGYWTLDYVANDSSSEGNFKGAPEATGKMEKTGAILCKGYRDGQGNSCKIVTVPFAYALVGGIFFYSGKEDPVATVEYYSMTNVVQFYCTGVVVLTK